MKGENKKDRINGLIAEIEAWSNGCPIPLIHHLDMPEDRSEKNWEAEGKRLADEVESLAGELVKDRDVAADLFGLAATLRGGQPDDPGAMGLLKKLSPKLRVIALAKPDRSNDAPYDDLVTLEQVAGLTGLRKRSLERYLQDGKICKPDRPGGGGRSNLWYYQRIKPDLEGITTHALPEKFPGTAFSAEQ